MSEKSASMHDGFLVIGLCVMVLVLGIFTMLVLL